MSERATGENIRDLARARLESVGLSEGNIIAVAQGTNVLRAVNLFGIGRQRCFAHGLDLVLRNVFYGEKVFAFDVTILTGEESSQIKRASGEEAETEDSESEDLFANWDDSE